MGKHVRAYVINSDIPSFALIPQVFTLYIFILFIIG